MDPRPEREAHQLNAEDKATLRTANLMSDWQNTEGWKVYSKIVEYHLQMKRNELEGPTETGLDGIAQILRAESAKGAIIALRLCLGLPESMVVAGDSLRKLRGLPTAGEQDDE